MPPKGKKNKQQEKSQEVDNEPTQDSNQDPTTLEDSNLKMLTCKRQD
jgi:hypothetical protein